MPTREHKTWKTHCEQQRPCYQIPLIPPCHERWRRKRMKTSLPRLKRMKISLPRLNYSCSLCVWLQPFRENNCCEATNVSQSRSYSAAANPVLRNISVIKAHSSEVQIVNLLNDIFYAAMGLTPKACPRFDVEIIL